MGHNIIIICWWWCSVAKSRPILCNHMDCSMPGYTVLHYLPKFVQIQVHWVSWWCCLTISSSATPFSFCFQSFPASGSFPRGKLFKSGGQSIGTSASASVLPMNIQDWFPWGLTGLISLQSKGFLKVFSSTIVQKHQFFGAQQKNWVQLSHPYMTTGKNIALTICTFVGNILTLFFNMLSRFVIAFLPRSKHLLIPWL